MGAHVIVILTSRQIPFTNEIRHIYIIMHIVYLVYICIVWWLTGDFELVLVLEYMQLFIVDSGKLDSIVY